MQNTWLMGALLLLATSCSENNEQARKEHAEKLKAALNSAYGQAFIEGCVKSTLLHAQLQQVEFSRNDVTNGFRRHA